MQIEVDVFCVQLGEASLDLPRFRGRLKIWGHSGYPQAGAGGASLARERARLWVTAIVVRAALVS
jgi:hypothetical protein